MQMKHLACSAAAALMLTACGSDDAGSQIAASADDGSSSEEDFAGEIDAELSPEAKAAARGSGPLPEELPLYPGATDVIKQTDGQVTRFTTRDAPEMVAAFYGTAMKAKFGEATVTGMSGWYTASYFNPGAARQIQIVARSENGATTVSVGAS